MEFYAWLYRGEEHAEGPLLKCVPKTVDKYGNMTYDIQAPSEKKLPTDGDEKRVKQLEVQQWSKEDMQYTFKSCIVIVVDGEPFGIGWRSNNNAFTTPFHMGPVRGKSVELIGVKDYIDKGKTAHRATIDVDSTEIHALEYSGCRSQTGFDEMLVMVDPWVFSRIGVPLHTAGLYKGVQGGMVAIGFDMRVDGKWKPLVVHSGHLKSMPSFTALSGVVLHTLNTASLEASARLQRCTFAPCQVWRHLTALSLHHNWNC